MDKNGYNPSIMQKDLSRCFICGASGVKLDRHEIYHGDFKGVIRAKSKRCGLWVMLCYNCHHGGAHGRRDIADLLKREGQQRAMDCFGWNTDEWIAEFGKNYL